MSPKPFRAAPFVLSLILWAVPVTGQSKSSASEQDAPDFAISPSFLELLRQDRTILPTFKFTIGDHSKLHRLADDCEMHVAAQLIAKTPGDPADFILEPPNLCKIGLNGQEEEMSPDWAAAFDNIKDQKCDVTGFPRIFTEHAKSAGGPSNPLHFFEIHPAVSINCPGKSLAFGHPYLRVFQGMRAIKASSATACIEKRTLRVRYSAESRMYEFQESSGTCGNFAILELNNIPTKWIEDVGQGHSAIARESSDGETMGSLKIYTLMGSDIDTWLASLKQSAKQQRKIVLGLFTYDYFAMQKVLYNRATHTWTKPAAWTKIPYPLAFVVYGETEEAPWEE